MNAKLTDYKKLYDDCTLCPRECHARRTNGQKGYCRENSRLVVARAALHMWEEPCISGSRGSGTVFFSGCSVGCVYCQNHNIADGTAGKIITTERLSEIFLELQNKKAHNINLVTPSHFVPHIIEAVNSSRKNGLNIPIVYNTGSYEKPDVLGLLDGIADIYLPDLKYMDSNISERYSNCKDYFNFASKSISEMVRQVGECEFDSEGMLLKGVIVRHMMLPGYLEDSKNIIRYLHETFGSKIYISIMNQYTPLNNVKKHPEIDRKITDEEYKDLINYAISIGIENGFLQEGETQSESFIPEFNCEGV
ncbi:MULTISPECIES: radical SAM protein [unclassified Sedimentibacter]|uniref:radical SAM protein n=1 Tax=unclassified Sedimentibacter TaxID=2649220 RepID=UPI0027DEB086|nr:4Fe-4S cluster-binding domain-containing protein [Sedimentibacter sp. MB35-C1]WMJ76829.1 radical SAM protein [Sedimentibacter sp. MB35-C1]